jgi:hypothetical protein
VTRPTDTKPAVSRGLLDTLMIFLVGLVIGFLYGVFFGWVF